MPPPVAREMILLARRYGGEEARAMGLVHRCLPDRAALEAEAARWAGELSGRAPLALVAAKAGLRELLRRDGAPDLPRCKTLDDTCYNSADFIEGRAAFREKRPPRFLGR